MTLNLEQKTLLLSLLTEASELLNEVRTGEDFEVTCQLHADKIDQYVAELKKVQPI